MEYIVLLTQIISVGILVVLALPGDRVMAMAGVILCLIINFGVLIICQVFKKTHYLKKERIDEDT